MLSNDLQANDLRALLRGQELDIFRAIRELDIEKHLRVPRFSIPRVVHFNPSDDEGFNFIPPGSITLFMAPDGSPLLDDIIESLSSLDSQLIAELASKVERKWSSGEYRSVKSVAQDLMSRRVIADLRYGSKTLAENLGLPYEIEFGILSFPYNGGDLDDNNFTLVEYFKPGVEDKVNVVLIRRPPEMTDAERIALEQVPPEQLEINIGTGGSTAFTPTLVVTVTLFICATTMHTPTITGGEVAVASKEFSDKLKKVTLSAERIENLGPVPSARELLALRQEIFVEEQFF